MSINTEKNRVYMPPKCDIVVLSTECNFLGSKEKNPALAFEDDWDWE